MLYPKISGSESLPAANLNKPYNSFQNKRPLYIPADTMYGLPRTLSFRKPRYVSSHEAIALVSGESIL